MLPYLDGFELRALQKRSPLVSNVPVLVISAYDLDAQSILELGLPPPLRKPLDIEKLLSGIRDLMAA
jgi:DNA-binding response OmpR family regulator